MTRCFTSRLTLSSGNLISGKKSCWNEQTTIPEAPTCIAEFLHVTARYAPPGWRISTPFPFKIRGKACVCGTLLSFRIDLPMSNCCSHEDSARSSTHQQWITNGAASSVNHHSTTAKDKTKRRSTAPPITRAQVNILEAKKCPETPSPADFAALKDWSETWSSTLPAYVVTPRGRCPLVTIIKGRYPNANLGKQHNGPEGNTSKTVRTPAGASPHARRPFSSKHCEVHSNRVNPQKPEGSRNTHHSVWAICLFYLLPRSTTKVQTPEWIHPLGFFFSFFLSQNESLKTLSRFINLNVKISLIIA